MASFETGLYDENLNPRADFGLADVFGIRKAGDAVGTNGNPYYARIEHRIDHPHPHPRRVQQHQLDSRRGKPHALSSQSESPVLTVVPGFVRYPPELAYPPHSHTDEPAVVLRESRRKPHRWFAGDVERTYWSPAMATVPAAAQHHSLDHRRYLDAARGRSRIHRDVLLETAPGYAVHLLNYSNPDAQHGWLQSTLPLGPQQVAIKLPPGLNVKSVELLQAEKQLCPIVSKTRCCISRFQRSKITR